VTAITSIQQCPACGNLAVFKHVETTLLQCSCGKVIERKNGVLTSRQLAVIQEPADLIQPGTEGKWNGKAFTVLGRFRVWVKEFVINYWTIVFKDNTIAYLGEGYGLYSIYEKTVADPGLTSDLLHKKKAGKFNDFSGKPFLLERKHECYKWEIEAEAYLPECDATFRIFEYACQEGYHKEIMELQHDQVDIFNVSYTSFPALQLSNTRSFQPGNKSVSCKKCSLPNVVKYFPYSQSFVCVHCSARHTLTGNQFELQKHLNKIDSVPAIKLGAFGTIKGTNYEVTGFTEKQETKVGQSRWREYTLFNPGEGFANLSEYDGNWIFVKEKGNAPVLAYQEVTKFDFGGEPFLLFNKYSYEVMHASGEFPYNIYNDEDKVAREFISPPEVWIQEKSNAEGITWYLGEHLKRKELMDAFGDAIDMPYKSGVGAVEPKTYVSTSKIVTVALAAVLLMLIAHLVSVMYCENRVLIDRSYNFNDSLNTITFVTDKFQLDKKHGNLQFDVLARVDNSWFELNASLVDAVTGTEYTIEKGVEYYHGYSDGESWTEGNQRETAYMNSIPAGTYYLQIAGTKQERIEGFYPAPTLPLDRFYLEVIYDVPNHNNLFIFLFLLLIFPFIQFQVIQYYERSRWSNSPFSPYDTYNQ
jgi:hypothetical protein